MAMKYDGQEGPRRSEPDAMAMKYDSDGAMLGYDSNKRIASGIRDHNHLVLLQFRSLPPTYRLLEVRVRPPC